MKFTFTILAAGSCLFVNGGPSPPSSDLLIQNTENVASGAVSAFRSSSVSRANGDDGAIINLAKQGKCFAYVQGSNPEKSKRGCKTVCEKKGASQGYGCATKLPLDFKPNNVNSLEDEDGNRYVPGDCWCECEVCDYMVDLIVDGLAELDGVLCAAVLSAFTTIADVGLQFVPGGAPASAALRVAVAGAKGFAENGLGAASFFGNWVGKACGKPEFNFDLMSVFDPLVNAPDSIATSPGCKRRNRVGCKRLDPKPDPPKNAAPQRPPKSTKKAKPPKSTTKAKPPKSTKTAKPPKTAEKQQPSKATTTPPVKTTKGTAQSIARTSRSKRSSEISEPSGCALYESQ